MRAEAMLQPAIAMALLTCVVWVYMYYKRLGFMYKNNIDPQVLHSKLTAKVNLPSDNLKNLFEMPVLFYLICLIIYITVRTDAIYVSLGFTYVALRCVHSFIHCTYNKVLHRFVAYALSSIVLGIMLLRLSFDAFN